MQPRLDDATIEYQFSDIEKITARILDPVKIAWIQTKYAETWKGRNSTPAPEDPANDRSYFLKIAELDGYMRALQELLNDHKDAIAELNARKLAGENIDIGTSDQSVGERASQLVHRIPTGN